MGLARERAAQGPILPPAAFADAWLCLIDRFGAPIVALFSAHASPVSVSVRKAALLLPSIDQHSSSSQRLSQPSSRAHRRQQLLGPGREPRCLAPGPQPACQLLGQALGSSRTDPLAQQPLLLGAAAAARRSPTLHLPSQLPWEATKRQDGLRSMHRVVQAGPGVVPLLFALASVQPAPRLRCTANVQPIRRARCPPANPSPLPLPLLRHSSSTFVDS